MEFFVRFKNEFVLIFVLLAQTVALAVQVRRVPEAGAPETHGVRLLRLWAASAVTPVARTVHLVDSGVRGGWSNYVALWHVRQQNQDLRNQLAAMRLQQAAEAEDMIQGHRLQALLGFREHYLATTVAAQVIGTSGSEQSRLLLIDKGEDAGLKPDMPVITPEGIVGKLGEVFPHSAQLLLISDPSAGAGVILESTRIRAVLKGTASGRVQIGNLTADSRIQPGDKVLTSGGDQVFPRGLPVGVVESIAPDPEHQPYSAITVRPAAKLAQLEEVLVITGTQPDLPAQAQADLSAAEAQHKADVAQAAAGKAAEGTAATEKGGAASGARGLDLSGGKPEDGSAASPAASGDKSKTPAGKEPGGVVPKPVPTLHPDRYTPGATPAAGELTPGAPSRAGSPAVMEGARSAAKTKTTPKPPPASPDAGTPGPAKPEEPR